MRIVCCVNRDLGSNQALNLLLPQLEEHTTRLVCSARVGRAAPPEHLRPLNLVEQAFPHEVVFPIVERWVPRGQRWLSLNELAEQHTGSAVAFMDLNSAAGAQLLEDFAPDLIITIRYGHILKGAAIAVPRHGVLNLHSGILPDYRGILSTLHAMVAGEVEVGCTLHWIVDAGIDTGPIVAVARRPVEAGRSLLWHVLSLYPLGVPLIVEAVRRLTSGEALPRVTQAVGEGSYRSFPTAADVAALRGRGVELLDAADLRDLADTYGAAAAVVVGAVGAS